MTEERRSAAAPCSGLWDLFFGPDLDGRQEKGRSEREDKARRICLDDCKCRMDCLENALVLGEEHGVWGGMSESERKKFREHLRAEGYTVIPQGDEFWAALNSFYREQERILRRQRGLD